MKKNRIYIAVLGVILCISAFAVPKIIDNALSNQTVVKEGEIANMPEKPYVHMMSGSLAPVEPEELFSNSQLVVVGKATGESQSLLIRSVDGGEMIHTDTFFEVSEVLRGETDKSILALRHMGGSVGNETLIFDNAPELKEGQEYVLFLYNPNMGGGFNAAGDHYYIYGAVQGMLTANEDGMYEIEDDMVLSKDELIEKINEYPVDKDHFRNEFIDNQKGNLESGFITKEDYDKMMKDLDVYATVVEYASVQSQW